MNNTVQLYIDKEKQIKGYPITSPDRVIDENGISIKENIDEIIEARDGEETLGAKIKKFNEQLNNITTNHLDINIRDYGAKCDGVHDDTQAIKKAIEVLKNHGGKCSLNLTAGTILISENIVIPPLMTIYGQGIYKTTIKAKQGVTIVLDITNEYIYNNEFYDFTISGANINNITGILFKDSTNKTNDEQCKFSNILIEGCTDSFIVGGNNRGNIFTNITIQQCTNGMILDGTDNFLFNCAFGCIKNNGLEVNGANNHIMLCKGWYCDKNGIVVNGNVNTLNVEAQENGLEGIVINGFSNNITLNSDSNGRLEPSYNILVSGYKNIINGLAYFNGFLAGNIKAHLKINNTATANILNIMCHGNKPYINEECISSTNEIVLNNKKYIKNLLDNGMQLVSTGGGQSFLKTNNFYNSDWLINYNTSLYQGCHYKKEIPLENNKHFDCFVKAILRGGNLRMIVDFYNNNNKLQTIESNEDLTVHHFNDSALRINGNIPNNANKCIITFVLYCTEQGGYSEAILLDYGFNVF